jgi:hypothetical protein
MWQCDVCESYSGHLRALYEKMSIDHFFSPDGWAFGALGPKLLSDYIASLDGAELRKWIVGPMFFNAIDWREIDRFFGFSGSEPHGNTIFSANANFSANAKFYA